MTKNRDVPLAKKEKYCFIANSKEKSLQPTISIQITLCLMADIGKNVRPMPYISQKKKKKKTTGGRDGSHLKISAVFQELCVEII